jgi:hypothetical protein
LTKDQKYHFGSHFESDKRNLDRETMLLIAAGRRGPSRTLKVWRGCDQNRDLLRYLASRIPKTELIGAESSKRQEHCKD